MDQMKLIAFDLDGTLTQHKEPLSEENRRVLDALAQRYRLVMVGAGQTQRIFRQLGCYPIDIIGRWCVTCSCHAIRSLWPSALPTCAAALATRTSPERAWSTIPPAA